VLKISRSIGPQLRDRLGRFMQNGVDDRLLVFPRKGGLPVSISYSTTPSDQRSVR
jgi:hypothetical protein